MTCIAGAVINREICIGGDAVSISRDANVRIGIAGKVFRLDEFLIGGSGTVRAGQLMRYVLQPPPLPQGEDLMAYMVTEFAPAVRTLMKEGGTEFTTSSNTVEMDGRYLVGVRGHLFSIDGGYGVFEPCTPYAAIGCADQEALAAMYTAYSLLKDPLAEDIVNRGLLAAAGLDTSIRPPFTIMTLPVDVSRETVIPSNGHGAKLAKV
jgi:hypothetical protein